MMLLTIKQFKQHCRNAKALLYCCDSKAPISIAGPTKRAFPSRSVSFAPVSSYIALLKSLTVVSTEAPISAFAESTGAKWRNLLKNRFLDSPAARSK